MSNENDIDNIPEPDATASAEELAHAKAFAALVDDMVEGKACPPAMATSQRELLTAATMIHASTTDVQLDDAKRDALIDKAFKQTLPEQLRTVDTNDHAAGPIASISSLDERRSRRAVPWLIAAVAAAAAVFFALRPVPQSGTATRRASARFIDQTPVSVQHRSRPADPLIGRIATTNSAAASQRLDRIFSDRMSGYRDLRLRLRRRARITSGAVK